MTIQYTLIHLNLEDYIVKPNWLPQLAIKLLYPNSTGYTHITLDNTGILTTNYNVTFKDIQNANN